MAFWNRKKKTPVPVDAAYASHDPNGYAWGGRTISPRELAPHYAVVGITGSGKTLMLSMLMQSVLGTGEVPRARALVYDPKLDSYPLLRGMGMAPDSIRVLHPFDERCTPWDLAKDIDSVSAAKELAGILCPCDKDAKEPFFSEAAQQLLEGVILVFCDTAPGNWILNDLVEATSTRESLERVLSRTPETADLLQQFATEPRTFANILSTLRSKLGPLGPAAAAWARAKNEPMSLRDWMGMSPLDEKGAASANHESSPPSVLLVGADDANDKALGPIMRALFRRASQLVTAQPDARVGAMESWFFLDEVRLAGRLEGLSNLLLKGRSKSAHVVLGFQDILGMREVYGSNVGNELVGQCGNMAFLRVTNPETAEWASKHIGKKEFSQETRSQGTSETKRETTTTKNRQVTATEKEVVPPQDFMLLQVPSLEKREGMRGVFATPGDRWVRTVHSRDIAGKTSRSSEDPFDVGFVPVPPRHQRRLLWEPADFERLGLSGLESSQAPTRPDEGDSGYTILSPDED